MNTKSTLKKNHCQFFHFYPSHWKKNARQNWAGFMQKDKELISKTLKNEKEVLSSGLV